MILNLAKWHKSSVPVAHVAVVGIDIQLEVFKSAAPHLGNRYSPLRRQESGVGVLLKGLKTLSPSSCPSSPSIFLSFTESSTIVDHFCLAEETTSTRYPLFPSCSLNFSLPLHFRVFELTSTQPLLHPTSSPWELSLLLFLLLSSPVTL